MEKILQLLTVRKKPTGERIAKFRILRPILLAAQSFYCFEQLDFEARSMLRGLQLKPEFTKDDHRLDFEFCGPRDSAKNIKIQVVPL